MYNKLIAQLFLINQTIKLTTLVVLFQFLLVGITLTPNIRTVSLDASLNQSDQASYIMNGEILASSGEFARDLRFPQIWEPYRTPGLPLIIAIGIKLFHSLIFVLLCNVIATGIITYYGILLLKEFSNNKLAIPAYALLMILLPNIAGLNAFILTDTMFSCMVMISIYQCYRYFYTNSIKNMVLASLAIAGAQLIKPTYSPAIILVLLMGLLFYRTKWKNLLQFKTLLLCFNCLVIPFLLSLQIYLSHGVFTPTLLGEETKREYLTANYFSSKEHVNYETIQQEIRKKDKVNMYVKWNPEKSYYGNLYSYKKQQNDSIFSAAPLQIAKVFSFEFVKQLIAPQEIYFSMFKNPIPAPLRTIGVLITLCLYLFILLGVRQLWHTEMKFYFYWVVLFYLFFIAAGSLSSRQSSRFRYPADIIALPLAAIGLASIASGKSKSETVANKQSNKT